MLSYPAPPIWTKNAYSSGMIFKGKSSRNYHISLFLFRKWDATVNQQTRKQINKKLLLKQNSTLKMLHFTGQTVQFSFFVWAKISSKSSLPAALASHSSRKAAHPASILPTTPELFVLSRMILIYSEIICSLTSSHWSLFLLQCSTRFCSYPLIYFIYHISISNSSSNYLNSRSPISIFLWKFSWDDDYNNQHLMSAH